MVLGPAAVEFASQYFGEDLITATRQQMGSAAEVKVYPNPASDLVTLAVKGFSGNTLIEVFDVGGKKVLSRSVLLRDGALSVGLDVTPLSSGVYVIRLTADSRMETARLAVSR